MSALERCASYDDYRHLARQRLPRLLFEYIDGGSYSEHTLRQNVTDLASWTIDQHVARDMSNVDLQTWLFGQSLSMPVILGPVGFAGMFARRGEVQAARAACSAGLPFCLSTVGICSADELVRASLPFWFQIYVIKDRGFIDALLDHLIAIGCTTIVVTVDLPTPGVRYRDVRSGMAGRLDWLGHLRKLLDGARHPRWLSDVYVQGRPHTFGNLGPVMPGVDDFAAAWDWIGRNFDPSVTWSDLERLRKRWPGTFIVKGVLHPEDAREAVAIGCDAIVISNHGGRQLDGARSTISALPDIAASVAGQAKILVDGGIRSGLDVLKMRRAGADACLLGRAWAMALAAGGTSGVGRMLGQIESELRAGVILSGTEL